MPLSDTITFLSGATFEAPYNQGGTGAVGRTVTDKLQERVTIEDFGGSESNSLFGRGGLKRLIGWDRQYHYSFGSVIEMPSSTKWVMVYRKASTHGSENGTECRAADSYDFGESWVNDRLLYTSATSDARPDHLSLMGNGRVGFFMNRVDATATVHNSPYFFYTDDNGVTFNSIEVTTSSPYTFAAVGGIIAFPASQGGHDTLGFISYGYLDAGGIDAFTTTDNGASWSTESDVGVASGAITTISENVQVRLGNTDRWLIFARAQDGGGWHDQLSVFATTDLLDWGTPLDCGVYNFGTPPSAFYDESTDKVYVIRTARKDNSVDTYHNQLLIVGEDADTLWSNSGVFTESPRVLLSAPHWLTGYVYPFSTQTGLCAAFSAGENVASGLPPSSMWLLGDFETKAIHLTDFVRAYVRNMRDVNRLEITAVDNVNTTYGLVVENAAGSASTSVGPYRSIVAGGGADYLYQYSNVGTLTYRSQATTNVVNYENEVTFEFDDDVFFEGLNYKFGTIAADIDGSSAMLHLPVSSSSAPAARSISAGTTSRRNHYILHNTNGEVGKLATTGTTFILEGEAGVDVYVNGSLQSRYTETLNTFFNDLDMQAGDIDNVQTLEVNAVDNSSTTYPVTITNSTENYGVQFGAYGIDNTTYDASNVDYHIIVGGDLNLTSTDDLVVTAGGTERVRVDESNDIVTFSTEAAPVLPSFTVGTLPTAGGKQGGMIYVTDETGGGVPAFSDGTDWRRVTDRQIVS